MKLRTEIIERFKSAATHDSGFTHRITSNAKEGHTTIAARFRLFLDESWMRDGNFERKKNEKKKTQDRIPIFPMSSSRMSGELNFFEIDRIECTSVNGTSQSVDFRAPEITF